MNPARCGFMQNAGCITETCKRSSTAYTDKTVKFVGRRLQPQSLDAPENIVAPFRPDIAMKGSEPG